MIVRERLATFNGKHAGENVGEGVAQTAFTFFTERGPTANCYVGTLDSEACNVDFCGTPDGSTYFNLEALEVWVH
jgi:hypothetical protein